MRIQIDTELDIDMEIKQDGAWHRVKPSIDVIYYQSHISWVTTETCKEKQRQL